MTKKKDEKKRPKEKQPGLGGLLDQMKQGEAEEATKMALSMIDKRRGR